MLAAHGWHPVADGVAVRTSRRELTITTLIVSDNRAVLVDPAWDPDELAAIAASLSEARVEMVAGFATHAHHDHLLWHPDLPDVPRWASPATAATARAHLAELLDALGADWPVELSPLVGNIEPLSAGTLPWEGPEIRLITHDAHSTGHTALWIPSSGVLIAGDMLSDVELPLPEETGLAAYRAGLDALLEVAAAAKVVIPGHGHPGHDSAARWHADSRYLDDVLAGVGPTDKRLSNPGMAQAHERAASLPR